MKENNLVTNREKLKNILHMGVKLETVDNFVNRNFSADNPNENLLTDITEFSIPAGKVYYQPL